MVSCGPSLWDGCDVPMCNGVEAATQLASGRFAVLDNGQSFCLFLGKPTIEQQLGRQLTANNAVEMSLGNLDEIDALASEMRPGSHNVGQPQAVPCWSHLRDHRRRVMEPGRFLTIDFLRDDATDLQPVCN